MELFNFVQKPDKDILTLIDLKLFYCRRVGPTAGLECGDEVKYMISAGIRNLIVRQAACSPD